MFSQAHHTFVNVEQASGCGVLLAGKREAFNKGCCSHRNCLEESVIGEIPTMEQQRAFVASPSLVFGFKRASFVCARQDVLMCRCSHRQYRVSMIAGDQRSEKQVPVEKLLVEHSDYADMSEFIVDVDDDDDDLDENIVEVIGPDGEVKEEKRKKIRKRTGSFVDEINMPPDSALTSDADRQPPISEDETAQYIRTAVKAADERKAGDILALRVSKLTYTASFIVIATGKNSPQVRAIGNLIEEDLVKKHQMPVRRRDGTANSGWLLLDCM
ncbi:unnamed protein product [Chondrus crispus]|uniref:Uncharacterized protein n=1 Tax=Chondrus crispus TaxID=2769 RepID=R7QQY2_CHOCR|nr:unnamed protein product [Chondrus crispus]CDF40514.1 unnamed protein product [Chondrus crispus]|eukprot:XP_005710808.1 unnamed protein product [Chondrus crispus]